MLKVVVSTLFDCTLINRRYQAGLSLLKELKLFDLEPILSLSQQQGALTDSIYSCWDSLAVGRA